MNAQTDSGLPACEFNIPHLTLKVDELIPSEVDAISPVVDKLMRLIRESACAPGREFAVETALREALANAILHGNRQDPRKKVRICCACQAGRGVLFVVKDEGEGFDSAKIPSRSSAKLCKPSTDEVQFRGGEPKSISARVLQHHREARAPRPVQITAEEPKLSSPRTIEQPFG